jgi:biotin carboxyl carrier protein
MNLERIERLVKLFGRSCARELQVESEEWRLSLRRAPAASAEVPAFPLGQVSGESESDAHDPALISITAPLVGIFRQGHVRLQPGDCVQAGDPVGSIESMKILSPVLAAEGGEIEEALVEDGQPVEYGHQLFLLRPLSDRDAEAEEEEA